MISEERFNEICNRYGWQYSQPTHSFYIDWNVDKNFMNAVYQLIKYDSDDKHIKMWPRIFINDGRIMTSDRGSIYIKTEKKLIREMENFMHEYKKLKIELKESKIQEDF